MEILAPAGNILSLKAAIANGANAVYLGMENFSARAKAENFNENNLKETVDFAHLFNVKVYLAMNTLIKNSEVNAAMNTVRFADSCGVDAIIVQDLGLLTLINQSMPHIVLHASTQMGIHNCLGATIAKKMGVSRIILSREVMLSDIKKIKENVDIEIEVFVQGALCVAFSGNCYFSSLVSGYSGNRGKCLQLCRKLYSFSDDEAYYLSPKDLCLLNNLKELCDAGVTSVKIEGRMRSAEYVGESVRVYNKVLNQTNFSLSENDINDLKVAFNRGDFCSGYLFNPTSENIIYTKAQNNIGLNVGNVSQIKNGIAHLNLCRRLSVGDGVKYMRNGKETGYGLITYNDLTTTFKGDVKIGDEVRLTLDSKISEKIQKIENKLLVDVSATFIIGQTPQIIVECNGVSVAINGDKFVTLAQNVPLTSERIVKSLSKLGDSYFKINNIVLKADKDIFYPISNLNSLKRELIELLNAEILTKYSNDYIKHNDESHVKCDTLSVDWLQLNDKNNIFLQTDEIDKISEAMKNKSDYIIFNPSCYCLKEIQSFKNKFKEKAVLNLPIAARGNDLDILTEIVENSGINIFVANNLYALELCKNKKIIGGIGLNKLNSIFESTSIISLESERYLYNNQNILYAFGHVPFMTFCHCPKKTVGGDCKNCSDFNLTLTDETEHKFYIRRYKIGYCYFQLLNNTFLNLTEELISIKRYNAIFDLSYLNNTKIKHIEDFLLSNKEISGVHTHGNYARKLY